MFPDVPVAAFTATATQKVQEDIINKIGLRRPHIVRASFNRPNLFYEVKLKSKVGAADTGVSRGTSWRSRDHLQDDP